MKNTVQLIGHVGQDPEVKSLEGGKKLANISIATNEVYYKENGDKVEKTEWHRVTAWGKTADIIAVPGNPFTDITVMEKVNFVMKAGKVYKSA